MYQFLMYYVHASIFENLSKGKCSLGPAAPVAFHLRVYVRGPCPSPKGNISIQNMWQPLTARNSLRACVANNLPRTSSWDVVSKYRRLRSMRPCIRNGKSLPLLRISNNFDVLFTACLVGLCVATCFSESLPEVGTPESSTQNKIWGHVRLRQIVLCVFLSGSTHDCNRLPQTGRVSRVIWISERFDVWQETQPPLFSKFASSLQLWSLCIVLILVPLNVMLRTQTPFH